ncbi:mRNA-decapping enzyme subunit 2 [Nosema granulosis]|uniref:mRNA-decapping enzyme subunit 2 n=1 Tax=Nosema granulosis TaxID=83296 RepID=A0A9P6GZJ7_9MICR|nr:mRNA-decapping enzyme subunit 2 [Nosema granulosis]
MKNKKKSDIPLEILDSISVRFLIDIDPFELENSERLLFILEEAHWFLIDNYDVPKIPLGDFISLMMSHNSIRLNVSKAMQNFVKYRQSIKVYGAIILNKAMDKILVVKEDRRAKNYGLPKGKKSKDEDGVMCATREVYEEIGFDIKNKIVDIPVTIFDKITFYFVFNVDENTPFKTQMNNEISEITWLEINRLEDLKSDKKYTLVTRCYFEWKNLHKLLVKNKFKFEKKKFEKIIKETLSKKHNNVMV